MWCDVRASALASSHTIGKTSFAQNERDTQQHRLFRLLSTSNTAQQEEQALFPVIRLPLYFVRKKNTIQFYICACAFFFIPDYILPESVRFFGEIGINQYGYTVVLVGVVTSILLRCGWLFSYLPWLKRWTFLNYLKHRDFCFPILLKYLQIVTLFCRKYYR